MSLLQVALIEDDRLLADGIVRALTQDGLAVEHFTDGRLGFLALVERDYSAAILDLNLPSMDGISILRELRQRKLSVPILILSVRDSVEDCVGGLNFGADDYLAKPFDLHELEARLRALLRRGANEIRQEIVVGRLRFDIFGRRASIGDTALSLSARETDLLEMLLARRGAVLAKEDVLDKLFGFNPAIGVNSVEVCMHRLRRKCAGAGLRISTLRGLGYVLEAEEE